MSQSHFNQLFDRWAPDYDQTVYDDTGEYNEVFDGYEEILSEIVHHLPINAKHVLEIGVGTGNLSQKLIHNGFQVIGVEPSEQMRLEVLRKQLLLDLREGHFLDIPLTESEKMDAIVSSYAFHHLTLPEKRKSVSLMKSFLKQKGMIIFADTAYRDSAGKQALFNRVKKQGKQHLLQDLKTEFYEEIDELHTLFEQEQFEIKSKQLNRFVWLLIARKK